MIIDCHTHIYPEKIAQKAVQSIGQFYGIALNGLQGTPDDLIRTADAAGVDQCLVFSAAVDGAHVRVINDFVIRTVQAHPDRFIGFGTLHPDLEEPESELRYMLEHGLKGVKLHPDMQRFALSEARADKLYSVCEGVCPMMVHTGDRRYQYSNPGQIAEVLKKHPKMRFICAHLGGWSEWEAAMECLLDTDVLVDRSSSFRFLGMEKSREMILRYGEDRVLFGSDYPVFNMKDELETLREMDLDDAFLEKVYSRNLLDLISTVHA